MSAANTERPVDSNDSRAAAPTDRRSKSSRVPFESLVAVASARGGSGFEAESVDLSPGGMRFRTAYLPRVGDRLVCRVDAHGAELVLEGDVLWRREQGRGGEFGIGFSDLDERAIDALRALYAQLAPGSSDDEQASARGTRVRLHIDGLGAPMKARVRDASSGELLVGSNLDFLRVGRALAIEDVEQGGKRDAYIDHVKVEIDPASNVPQLVVSLRYEGGVPKPKSSFAGRLATLPFGIRSPILDKAAPRLSASGDALGTSSSDAGPMSDDPEVTGSDESPSLAHAPTEPAESSGASTDVTAMRGRFGGTAAQVHRAGLAMASTLGPMLVGMGRRTKGAAQGLVASARRIRAERAEARRAKAPRRTTAPPPAGALKSEGRKLVRDDGSEAEESLGARSSKKAALVGSSIGLGAVLVIFGAVRFATAKHVAALPEPAQSPEAAHVSAETPVLAAPGTPTANVPLFGATPLSTTEPAPGAPVASSAPAGFEDVTAHADDNDDEPSLDDKAGDGKQFGSGDVANPIVLKIKMDGPVNKLSGASGPMGFTLRVADRRPVSAVADLAHKDRRIASVHTSTKSGIAEITFKFKNDAPGFLAKAKGDRIEILLGREGPKKIAKAHAKGSKKAKK